MVCLMGIGVGRVLFRTRDCSGEDIGIRRGDKASLLPALSASNMEIREFVGGMGCESTISASRSVFTLWSRRGLREVDGVGLALRLAASVAAMRLGLLASSLASVAATPAGVCGESPRARSDDGDVDEARVAADFVVVVVEFVVVVDATPSCCRRAATSPAGRTV